MSLIAKNEGSDFTPVPQGTHLATCYLVADLGMQPGFKPGTLRHKVLLGWEIPAETLDDGRPMTISKRYTLSLHPESNLGEDLISWRGRAFTDDEEAGFYIGDIVGAACQLSIIHKERDGKTYANIAGVMALPKWIQAPPLVNEAIVYDLDNPDAGIWAKLPEWIQKIIEGRGKPAPAAEPPKAEQAEVPF